MVTMPARIGETHGAPGAQPAAPPTTRRTPSTVLLVGVLLLATIVILRGISKGEFNYNVDETQHSVTGLYFADVLKDRPILHPVQYTYMYYAQYPALSGVVHWPPFYYLFEGVSFLVFGRTVVAARLSILLFALLGLSFWFELVKELQNEWTAALSAALLAVAPGVLPFEKMVMLEIPSLSLCIAATYFWTRYLLEENRRFVWWFAGFASAALLTKQNSIYLVLFCLLSVAVLRKWRLILKLDMVWPVAMMVFLVSPFYILVSQVHWKAIAMDLDDRQISGWRVLSFYWQALPGQLGWTLLGLCVLGIVSSRLWDKRPATALMLSWIAAGYVTFTMIGLKEYRYIIYWIPPFLYFASGLLTRMFRARWCRAVMGTVAVCILASSAVSAWFYQRPYVNGYAAVARRITDMSRSGIILYDGNLPGNFIFFMRAYDPGRRFLILRKALYAYRIKQRGGGVELVHGRQGIEDLLRRDGIRFIVVSDSAPQDFEVQHALRELLQAPQFQVCGEFPITDSEAKPSSGHLLLYENLDWGPPTDKFLRIKMLTLGHDIVVPLDGFMNESK